MGRNKKKKSEKKQNIEEIEKDSEISDSDTLKNSCNDFTNTIPDEKELHDTSDKLLKRPHDSENSDVEEEPKKRKKKKKAPVVAEEPGTTGKKNNKSIRQLKREKYAARLALQQAQAKDQTKSQCLSYLSQWKHDRQNWKFMKARQAWLSKNIFSTHLIPDAIWPTLLEYFESAQGNIKTILLNDANKVIKQMDDWMESHTNKDAECDKEQLEATEVVKPDEAVYNRARSLIQCLQE